MHKKKFARKKVCTKKNPLRKIVHKNIRKKKTFREKNLRKK